MDGREGEGEGVQTFELPTPHMEGGGGLLLKVYDFDGDRDKCENDVLSMLHAFRLYDERISRLQRLWKLKSGGSPSDKKS